MTLKKNLKNSKFSIISSNEKDYLINLNNTIRDINESDSHICYVSLVRPYMEVLEDLNNEKINPAKICFIDTQTSKGQQIPSTDQCIFLPNSNIDNLKEEIKNIKNKNKDNNKVTTIFLDTVSALLKKEDRSTIIKFTHDLVSQEHYKDSKNIYFLVKDMAVKQEENSQLIKDLRLFANEEIDF